MKVARVALTLLGSLFVTTTIGFLIVFPATSATYALHAHMRGMDPAELRAISRWFSFEASWDIAVPWLVMSGPIVAGVLTAAATVVFLITRAFWQSLQPIAYFGFLFLLLPGLFFLWKGSHGLPFSELVLFFPGFVWGLLWQWRLGRLIVDEPPVESS